MRIHYKQNVCYILDIDGKYYVGCHCLTSKPYITDTDIVSTSGNRLNHDRQIGLISYEEYKERAKLIKVIECNNKDEALALERKLIKEYKDKYGSNCVNIIMRGNVDQTGKYMDRKWCNKIRRSMKGNHNKKIRNTITGEIYDSIRECCEKNNLCYNAFSRYNKAKLGKYKDYEYL